MEKQFCKLHGTELLPAEVPYIHDSAAYGTVGYLRAQTKFIQAGSYKLYGSYLMFKDKPSRMPALYCKTCRILQREWLLEHYPTRRGLTSVILEAHRDTDLYDDPVSMTARVYIKALPDFPQPANSKELKIPIAFGKGENPDTAWALFYPTKNEDQEEIAFEARKVYFPSISILEPNHVKDHFFRGAKFHGISKDGRPLLHGEITDISRFKLPEATID